MVILYQIETLRMYDRHILYCNGLEENENEKKESELSRNNEVFLENL